MFSVLFSGWLLRSAVTTTRPGDLSDQRMCLATTIVRRAGSASYYARLAVPKDLQPILKKRELWKSLETKDRRPFLYLQLN